MVSFWLCFARNCTRFADSSDMGGGGKGEIRRTPGSWLEPHERRGYCCLRGEDSSEAGLGDQGFSVTGGAWELGDIPAGMSKRQVDIGVWSVGKSPGWAYQHGPCREVNCQVRIWTGTVRWGGDTHPAGLSLVLYYRTTGGLTLCLPRDFPLAIEKRVFPSFLESACELVYGSFYFTLFHLATGLNGHTGNT